MSSPTPELKECPSCGQVGPTKVGYWPDETTPASRVRCVCGMQTMAGDEETCTKLWNTRAAETELREALKPFANVAEQIRKAAKDERWLETVLFYMGDDGDPTKWSLTGRAFDNARAALSNSDRGSKPNGEDAPAASSRSDESPGAEGNRP